MKFFKQLSLPRTASSGLPALTSAVAAMSMMCLAATQAQAGSPAAGAQKSATCVACHGEDGQGTAPEFPKLAGQYASYLEQALKQYRSGQRKNAIMAGFAAGLSDQDIADLAAYYASLDSGLTTPKE